MSPSKSILFALGLCLVPVAALAQQSPAREALKQACMGDYLEHCSEHAPGGPEVEACFQMNLKRMSLACSGAIAAYKQEQKATQRVSAIR